MSSRFLENPDVQEEIGKIRSLAAGSSDRLDQFFWLKAAQRDRGNGNTAGIALSNAQAGESNAKSSPETYRFVNIVLQGGGVLGLAHAGFVAGLENARIRLLGVAGASAGAIMAMAIVAVRGENLLGQTHEKLVEIVGSMPMETFIDGPYRARWLIKQFLLERSLLNPIAWPAILSAVTLLLRYRGLNSGNAFEDWLADALKDHGLSTIDELNKMLSRIGEVLKTASEDAKDIDNNFMRLTNLGAANLEAAADGKTRPKEDVSIGDDLLQIVAACSSLGVKFQFPRDVRYLAPSLLQSSPAKLVRASMSIPLFFVPQRFDVNKQLWHKFVQDRLGNLTDADQLEAFKALEEVLFLDGGIFSNLPADAFRLAMPDVPTIIVPLVKVKSDRPFQRNARISSLLHDFVTVGFMVRNQRDHDAIDQLNRSSQRYKVRKDPKPSKLPPTRMAPINVGNANWLNFVMSEEEMVTLFLIGLKKAREFLEEIVKDAESATAG